MPSAPAFRRATRRWSPAIPTGRGSTSRSSGPLPTTSASSCCSAPATPSAATSTRATGPSTAASARCSPAASSIRPLTRSFLDTGPPYAETGWAILAPAPLDAIDGRTLGALTLISGLDRIGLASYLRRHDVTVRVVRNGQDLVDGIAGGRFDGGVTEALLAGGLAADNDWWVAPLPDELARYNLVFGLWKGDLTLKRKIVQAFRQLESDGTLAAILERYGAAPIAALTFGP